MFLHPQMVLNFQVFYSILRANDFLFTTPIFKAFVSKKRKMGSAQVVHEIWPILTGTVVNAAALIFMSTKHPDRLILFGLKTQRGSEFL